MTKIKLYFIRFIAMLAMALAVFASCSKRLKPATVVVSNPVQHLNPVPQGESLKILFEIENTSNNPLFIQEIQTTCGCIVPKNELPIVILPHRIGTVHLSYNTIKNTGYVDHFVYCYGNFDGDNHIELEFDTNVVPRADYIRDYEQLSSEYPDRFKKVPGMFDEERYKKTK